MLEFIEKILTTLKDNGFPDKKVSLPTEKMYEAADKRGLSFNKVLDQIKASMEIDVEITDEKIIFAAKASESNQADQATGNPFAGMNFGNMDPAQMMQKAQQMMSQMDPAELKKMQEMFLNMSEEEKAEILKKGKDLGLI